MNVAQVSTKQSDLFFTSEDHGSIAFMHIKPHEGLFGIDLFQAKQLWDYLEEVSNSKKKILVITLPPNFLNPSDIDDFEKRGHAVSDVTFQRNQYRTFFQHHPESKLVSSNLNWEKRKNVFYQFAKKIRQMDTFVICTFSGEIQFSFMGIPLVCDYRIVSDDTVVSSNSVQTGTMPCGTFPWFLSHYLGQGKAATIIYDDRSLSAQELLQLGLVNCVVNSDNFELETVAKAKWFAEKPSSGLIYAKRMLNVSQYSFEEYIDVEGNEFARWINTSSS